MRRGDRWAWVVGGYLAGTIPSAYVVARAWGLGKVVEEASAASSEGDAHLLIAAHGGPVPAAIAMAGDVAKGALVALAAQRAGLEPGWRAAAGVAAVAGHAFPFSARPFAGRGLATAAGVTLVNLPGAMVVAGSVILAGKSIGHTGPATTAGFAAVPLVAALQGRPRAMVAMGAGILGVILARRLVGVRWSGPSAVLRRLAFDADDARGGRTPR